MQTIVFQKQFVKDNQYNIGAKKQKGLTLL